MTIKELTDRILLEIELTKKYRLGVGDWTEEYREGFTDGLKRSIELSDDKN